MLGKHKKELFLLALHFFLNYTYHYCHTCVRPRNRNR